MTQPADPLIIWAEDNITLPVSGQPNKIIPQDSLRKTGWDEGQNPSCEEFNYILNNLAQYINYYGTEKTQEFLTKAANLSDLTDVAAARNNLSVYSQAQVNAKQINTGTGLTGGGDLSSNRSISLDSVSSCISILTGTILNGETIPLPSGYNHAQCKWTVGAGRIFNLNSGDINEFTVSVDSNRLVSVLSEGIPDNRQYANYIIIGVK